MTNRRLSCVVVSLSSVLLTAGGASAQATTRVSLPAQPVLSTVSADFPGGVTEHVILVSIDGLRPDAIGEYDAPTLRRLMAEGSYSLSASTIMPSKTLPSHTSMLTGVGPEVHGITWNTHAADRLEYVQVPTVFELVRAAGLSSAAFVAKAKFRHIFDPSEMDYFEAPPTNATTWPLARTVERAVNYMRHEQPNFLFVHFGEPDFVGHTIGWMSQMYGWAVTQADAGVGAIVAAADETYGRGNYTIVVTADHGGHSRTHGSAATEDRWIPWIAHGAGVRAHTELLPGIRTFDTAATVLWALGLEVPASFAGRPVVSAFETAEPSVATVIPNAGG